MAMLTFQPEGLSTAGRAVLASTLWIAVWWILEVIPIAVTALLPIVLFPLTGALSLNETTASFGHRYIFLCIGGFVLAIAIERWGLHRRITLNIINLIGTNVKRIILGFMIATAFLSMWISNTATSVMMLPIGMAIISQLRDNPDTVADENTLFGKALMLAIAYSASIGGVATLIGTPPNLVLAGIVQELYDIEITFSQWIMVGATLAASCAFMLPVATPPNAVVFGAGYLKIPDMVRAGIWLNVISIIIITLLIYVALPYLWAFNPNFCPAHLK
ncbi:MAG: anion permease [Phaeodactylibacter sp.]|nr:anion permease [Phaeodactylibacter sp.]